MSMGFDGAKEINIATGSGTDPMVTALLAGMNNNKGGFGGDSSLLVLFLLFAMCGRDGGGVFGRGNPAATATFANQQTDFLALMEGINNSRQDIIANGEAASARGIANNNIHFGNLLNTLGNMDDKMFNSALSDKDNTASIISTINCTANTTNANISNSTNTLQQAMTNYAFNLSSMFKDGMFGLSKENAQLSEKINALACQQGVNTEKVLNAIAQSNCDLTNKIVVSEKDEIIRNLSLETARLREQMTQLICAQSRGGNNGHGNGNS